MYVRVHKGKGTCTWLKKIVSTCKRVHHA